MKAITRISVLITCIFFTITLSAQRPIHQGPHMGNHAVWEELDLSDEQQKAIMELRKEQRQAASDIRSDDQMDREEKRTAMKSLADEFKSKATELLTAEQKAQLEKHWEAMEDKMQERQEKMEERKDYFENTVKPKLVELRKEFDSNISNEDQKIIAALQEDHVGRKPRFGKDGKRRPQGKSEKDMNRTSKPDRSEVQEKAKTIKTLVAKYYDDIQEVFEENEDLFLKWKEKMKPEESNNDEVEKHENKRMQHRRPGARHRRAGGLFSPEIRFLLMPTDSIESVGLENRLENQFRSEIRVFPNPSSKRLSIAYQLESSGPVSIQILDSNGSVLQNHDQGNQSNGRHRVNLEDLGLNAGTYYVQVTSHEGNSTKKVIITE